MKKITLLLLFTLSSLAFFAQEEETIEMDENVKVSEDVPFSIIENVPIYPGCIGSKVEKRKCFQKSIQLHIMRKFNTELANVLGLDSGKKRVIVIFKIDKNGDIVEVRAIGPHERLEKEAIRVVKLLPKMIPGKQRGRPIGVKYTLPITLIVEETKKEEIEEVVEMEEEDYEPEDVPFAIIEDAPIFPGCEKLDKNLRKMCLQNQIKKHVAANFNTSLANKLDLASGKKRVYVVFKINKNGDVVDLRARGPHKRLEMEAMRVVKLLPKMIPGKLRGKPVGVKYTLPITFIVEDSKVNENKKNTNGN